MKYQVCMGIYVEVEADSEQEAYDRANDWLSAHDESLFADGFRRLKGAIVQSPVGRMIFKREVSGEGRF